MWTKLEPRKGATQVASNQSGAKGKTFRVFSIPATIQILTVWDICLSSLNCIYSFKVLFGCEISILNSPFLYRKLSVCIDWLTNWTLYEPGAKGHEEEMEQRFLCVWSFFPILMPASEVAQPLSYLHLNVWTWRVNYTPEQNACLIKINECTKTKERFLSSLLQMIFYV